MKAFLYNSFSNVNEKVINRSAWVAYDNSSLNLLTVYCVYVMSLLLLLMLAAARQHNAPARAGTLFVVGIRLDKGEGLHKDGRRSSYRRHKILY